MHRKANRYTSGALSSVWWDVSCVVCAVLCVVRPMSPVVCVCVPVIPWTRRLSFKAPSSLPVGLGQPQAVHGGACLGRATATPSPGRARPGRVWPGRARAGRARPVSFGPAAPSNTSLVWHRSARAGLAGPARACFGPAAPGPVAPGSAAPARPRLARPRPAAPRLLSIGVPGPAWPGPPGLACPCLGVGAQLGPN